MDYLVIDGGFKLGKERNVLFASNDKQEAIKAAKDSGAGVAVFKQSHDKDKSEEIVFVSAYKEELNLSE